MRLLTLELTNFLSYREARIDFGAVAAMVGPNASGKSNAVAALKLLRDIPEYGLQTALLRRGGFDQLRHRSEGRPYDPSLAVEFETEPGLPASRYELHFASTAGGRYAVKRETAELHTSRSHASFLHTRGRLEMSVDGQPDPLAVEEPVQVPPGQSAMGAVVSFFDFYDLWRLMQGLQIVEVNPQRVRELQDATPGYEFAPDGSNCASVFEGLATSTRRELIDELAAIVPTLTNIEVRRFSNKMTLNFFQRAGDKTRSFLANQMSDGTLRAFAIVLALFQPRKPVLLVVEEPEIAIHLGALRTLVEVLREHSAEVQILMTTHSADIIDALSVDELRVVWSEDGISHAAAVAEHTRDTVRTGLISPGELLRSDSLDPALT